MSHPTTTPAAWLAAIISTLQSEYSTRAQPLSHCALMSFDDNGRPAIPDTPAILLEIGPTELAILGMGGAASDIGGRVNNDTERTEWRAYHIVSSRRAITQMERDTWEMCSITRAILRAADPATGRKGQRWGLGAALEIPEPEIEHHPVDLELPGYACRRLTWTQSARLVDSYP